MELKYIKRLSKSCAIILRLSSFKTAKNPDAEWIRRNKTAKMKQTKRTHKERQIETNIRVSVINITATWNKRKKTMLRGGLNQAMEFFEHSVCLCAVHILFSVRFVKGSTIIPLTDAMPLKLRLPLRLKSTNNAKFPNKVSNCFKLSAQSELKSLIASNWWFSYLFFCSFAETWLSSNGCAAVFVFIASQTIDKQRIKKWEYID